MRAWFKRNAISFIMIGIVSLVAYKLIIEFIIPCSTAELDFEYCFGGEW